MSRISGSGGDVFAASQLIEDCEDAFNEQVDGDVTASLDNSDYKVGSGSAKFVLAAGIANGDIIASEVINPALDLTGYTSVMFKMKSSVAINTAGDLQLLLDEEAMCASPLALDIPILAANTWKTCRITANLADYNATISVGLKLTANDPGACSLWIDEIRAAKQVAGVKSWSIDYKAEVLETTGFDSSGVRTYVPGIKSWSGSFEGYKDGAPLAIGSIVYLELRESSTATQQYRGAVIITGLSVKTDVDGLVMYSYTFQGTDVLEVATA